MYSRKRIVLAYNRRFYVPWAVERGACRLPPIADAHVGLSQLSRNFPSEPWKHRIRRSAIFYNPVLDLKDFSPKPLWRLKNRATTWIIIFYRFGMRATRHTSFNASYEIKIWDVRPFLQESYHCDLDLILNFDFKVCQICCTEGCVHIETLFIFSKVIVWQSMISETPVNTPVLKNFALELSNPRKSLFEATFDEIWAS